MIKHIYLIRGEKTESYDDFHRRILDISNIIIKNKKPAALKFTLTTEDPPALSVIPFSKKKIAVISLVTGDESVAEAVVSAKGFSGAFMATEALPVSYTKSWKDGEATPGACLLTLFRKKKDQDYQTFIHRWHNGHTPLSLKLHPLWHYNRNVVEKKLTAHPQWFDGIVEEHMSTRKELLNIFKFFGKPHKVIQNMFLVLTDTKSFIDYTSMETYLVTEYHILS